MNSISYRPGRFARLHEQYPQIWEALIEPQFIAMMKVLSRRGVPAVSALDMEAELVVKSLETARLRGDENQVKQMIGNQIRQIMASEGFRKVEGKPVRSSWIFSWGAVYVRPDWYSLHVHRNRNIGDLDTHCISKKRILLSLQHPPSNCAKWVPYRLCQTRQELNFVLEGNLDDDFGWSWRSLCETVDLNGYVILTA